MKILHSETLSGSPPYIMRRNILEITILLSIFVDEWNYFSVPMVSIFIERFFQLNAYTLGLTTSAIVGGAAVGSIMGGWMTDRFGRKTVFLGNMVVFFISSVLTMLVSSSMLFIILRFITGIPVGSDLANGYPILMENLEPKRREKAGTKNTLMASMALVGINLIILAFLWLGRSDYYIWRSVIGISAIPAIICILLVHFIPYQTENMAGKKTSQESKTGFMDVFRQIHEDHVMRRTALFSWISGAASTMEVGTFAFFIPIIISNLGISSAIQSRSVILLVYSVGIPAGISGPALLSRIGLRKLSYSGYALTILAILGSGISLMLSLYYIVPLFVLIFVWGNHWNSQPILTSQSLVANPSIRGKATGITNFISLVPTFITVSLFPELVHELGLGLTTIMIVLAPISGMLASLAIFREVFGYSKDIDKAELSAFP